MRKIQTLVHLIVLLALISCQSNSKPAEADESSKVTTPVTVTSITTSSISKVINLTATSSYLRKNTVKSSTSGYITKTSCTIGQYVKAGSPLYEVKTKEADALSNFSKTNPELAFNGELTIKAPTSGIITEVTKQANDYVADGDQLCIIADQSSLVFLLNVPFEQNKHAAIGTNCQIVLPDSTRIEGTITSKLAAIDAVSQTQSFIVKPHTNIQLPENLTAFVQLRESTKVNTQVTDRKCILTDETMENFWVMKLINDSTAVKIPVKTGIVTDNQAEIISPVFDKSDRLINTGNYGLPDTARVNIIQP
ncbi:MAG TPA: RND transporter [Prolixibacteraceae bacterium]|jgi:biotin carboxyl carrier protein|nr:RND transporter [Prolixibacteraceae bacterium]